MKKKRRKTELNLSEVDLLNVDFLRKFLSGEGKSARIVSRFVSGLSAQHQKAISRAIKRARQLNLI